MYSYNNQNQTQVSPAQTGPAPIQTVSSIDPYVVDALMRLRGKCAVIETRRGALEGVIMDVRPDHVQLQLHTRQAFVRIAEIVWIMPL